MDWDYGAPEDSSSKVGLPSLGFYVGDRYKVCNGAIGTLRDISTKLEEEDKALRTYRRLLGFSEVVRKDLTPLIVEYNGPEAIEVFDAAIKLMADLTTPLECLFANPNIEGTSDESAFAVYQLKQYLSDIKSVFLDPKISKTVLTHMTRILEKGDKNMAIIDKHVLINCVILLRNILHIPEDGSKIRATNSDSTSNATSNEDTSSGETPLIINEAVSGKNGSSKSSSTSNISRQHQVLWNLFAHNLDSVIMSLIESNYFKMWSTPLVQLIALVYKDQHVTTLERLLHVWLESSLSESSEDNESNTSPNLLHQDGNGCCSSSFLTSTEPNSTDDSSDGNSGERNSDNGPSSEEASPEPVKIEENEALVEGSEFIDIETTSISATVAESVVSMGDPKDIPVANKVQDNTDAKSDVSSNDSCREPPRKKAALEGDKNLPVSNKKCQKFASDNDSGLSSIQMSDATTDQNVLTLSEFSGNDTRMTKPNTINSSHNLEKNKKNTGLQFEGSNTNPNKNRIATENKKDSSEEGNEGYSYVSGQANLKPKVPQEMNSTSSNEENELPKAPHTCLQKPRPKKKIISSAEKRELCRKKLIERSKSKSFKVKALVHHIPTDKDINNLFKEFTVDFLLKGYSTLITTLRTQLTTEENPDIDKSHFLWLITYFLKFASQLEVQLEQIGPVLTVETVAFLTFEGVRFYEELELAVREHKERPVDLTPHLRRIHLVVTALREFIQTLQTYANFTHFTERDKAQLTQIRVAVCAMRDLRQLFLLLIRHYNPSIQTRQYLNDVICANHVLLVLIENTDIGTNIMMSHLSQFATVEVMRQYGHLLENFDSNSEYVNDCIFTMMHHVCGDLNTPETLFIPQVLQTFSDIWEREDVQLSDEWEDLIEHVIQKFITTIRSNPHAYANLLGCINSYETVDENGFTKTQLDNLYIFYNQFEDAPDPIECIIDTYKRNQNQTKTRLSVIQALLSQGIISLAQYMSMMYLKSVLNTCKTEHEGSIVAEVGSDKCVSEGNDTELENTLDLKTQGTDQIETLKELLKTQGKESLLTWLQQTLLDACCVKINGKDMFKQDGKSLEPVLYHFNDINQSIPMVAWSKNQESGLQTETFMLLLHKLGFHLANDVGKCFPRIPHFWSADHLFQLALKLGPVQKEDLNVDTKLLEIYLPGNEETKEMIPSPLEASTKQSESDPLVAMDTLPDPGTDLHPFTMPTPTTSWIQLALTSKKKAKKESSAQEQKILPTLSEKRDTTSTSMEKMSISDDETL